MKKENILVVIQNGVLDTIDLDDKLEWIVGRPSTMMDVDIKLYSATISRNHGKFKNIDGVWLYIDNYGKNGTILNGVHLEIGKNNKKKGKLLEDGAVFIFGGGREPVINSKTVFAVYLSCSFDEGWKKKECIEGSAITIIDSAGEIYIEKPVKGAVIKRNDGIVIYMGDYIYYSGNINVII